MYKKFIELRPDYKDVVNMIITPSNKDSEEMQKASDNLNFERAIELKKMLEDIDTTLRKQKIKLMRKNKR